MLLTASVDGLPQRAVDQVCECCAGKCGLGCQQYSGRCLKFADANFSRIENFPVAKWKGSECQFTAD